MQYILQGRIYVTIGTKNNKYGEISGRLSEDLNTRKGKDTTVLSTQCFFNVCLSHDYHCFV